MFRPTPTQLGNDVPANLGDPVFLAWTLRWVGHQLLNSPLNLFDGNIFWPHDLTLAYSDPMLSIAPVFAVWHAITGGWAPALNLTILSLVFLNLCATFALARWLTGRTDAALVAAVANAFSSFVLGHWGHVQLHTLGLFPLAFLVLFKTLEERRARSAALLGVVSAVLLTSALYYAAIYVVVVAVIVAGYVVMERFRPGPGLLRVLAIAAGVSAVLVAPVVIAYLDVRDVPGMQRPLVPSWGLDATDFLHPAERSYVHDHFQPPSWLADPWEHRFFPGLIVIALAVVGLVLFRSRRGREAIPEERRRHLLLLVIGGAVAGALALGPDIHGFPGPFRFFHAHVPGFDGIRVAARLGVVTVLVIALLAALGYSVLAQRVRWPWTPVVAVAVVGIALVELAAPLAWARLPVDRRTLGPYRALESQPAGAVIELPMRDPRVEPEAWAFVEAPRMLYSTVDWHPRVNGYTSTTPPDYYLTIDKVADFPSAAAVDRLRELRVRYVVLHVGTENGFAAYSEADAQAVVEALPRGWRARRTGSAWLLTSPSEPKVPRRT